jgi:hypothetical protein
MFNLTHPVNFPHGREPEHAEKTYDFRQSVDGLFSHETRTQIERWKALALMTTVRHRSPLLGLYYNRYNGMERNLLINVSQDSFTSSSQAFIARSWQVFLTSFCHASCAMPTSYPGSFHYAGAMHAFSYEVGQALFWLDIDKIDICFCRK